MAIEAKNITTNYATNMDNAEIQRRDQVLRSYFKGRDWDKNNEYNLTRHLVLNSQKLFPEYPFIIDDQWEAKPNRNHEGEGDLLFTDGEGRFAVVEVKWIDEENSGPTTRKSRNKKRNKVKEQAADYAHALAQRLEMFTQIEGYWFTNEYKQPQLAKQLP